MAAKIIPFPSIPWWLRETEYHSRKILSKPRKVLFRRLDNFPTVVKIKTAFGEKKKLFLA